MAQERYGKVGSMDIYWVVHLFLGELLIFGDFVIIIKTSLKNHKK